MTIPELLLRIVIAFVVLFALARTMGRKEISQMTFFNFVSAIAIGSITANLAISQNLSIRNGIIALAGWAVFTIAMGFIDIKSKKARKLTTGEPIIVIKEGKIMENSLRSTRLDMDSLNALLRQKGVFSLKDVDYAVFETSGQLSVLKKIDKQPATKGDLNIQQTPSVNPSATQVISDGNIILNNLKRLNLDDNWLTQQLDNNGINNISEVFYAEVQKDGSLYIDVKDDNMIH
ncbi:Uncharacterized membrane protein YcaP, DUF421 family [Gracilibacillus ureilyticus]|uniref:Uncharacterized membrane protein YcaP, DUF421 family n=1 Tax=Gracilibacillus ureilyticus TaxID=531814 RepID=A0A1H9TVP3_9BACI|nr:DUF421 domain-containing protein [Gracilibacillus ureilyticus]SES01305.1 Uncharacterized membrane protein YcaP, DUF421 family [Gracilibacillus ureilyticus]